MGRYDSEDLARSKRESKVMRRDNGGPVEAHKGINRSGPIRDDGMGDPDVGPEMREGMHSFNKGYVSDNDYFSPPGAFNDNDMRGNRYMQNQNTIVRDDSKKLKRDQFTKIA